MNAFLYVFKIFEPYTYILQNFDLIKKSFEETSKNNYLKNCQFSASFHHTEMHV